MGRDAGDPRPVDSRSAGASSRDAPSPEPTRGPGNEGSRWPQELRSQMQPEVPSAPPTPAPEPEIFLEEPKPQAPEFDEGSRPPPVLSFEFEPKVPPPLFIAAEDAPAPEVASPVEAPGLEAPAPALEAAAPALEAPIPTVEAAPDRRPEPALVAVSEVPFPSPGAPTVSASDLAAPSSTEFPEFAAATDRDSIAAAALAAITRRFPRGAVFVARPHAVAAWGAAGEGTSPDHLRDFVIPWDEPSVFLNVRLSRSFYLGPLPPLPRHEAIAVAMGGWPQECLVQAILIKDRPVAFLYAEFTRDHGATPMDLAYMRELAATASAAFTSAIRLKKREI